MSKPGYYGPYGYGIINDKTGKFVKLSEPNKPEIPEFIKQGARDLGTGAMSTLGKIGGGISAVAENPYVSAVSDTVYKYGIDPLAELAVRAGSADVLPNIFDPSKPNTNLLKMLTTEAGSPQDFDTFMGAGGTQPAFENKYIDKGDGTFEIDEVPVIDEEGAYALEYKRGLIPTAKRIAKIPGLLGDMGFKDARNMGEFLEGEDTFFSRRISDNPDKAQRLGARVFLADVFPFGMLNKLFQGSFKATDELANLQKTMAEQAQQRRIAGSAGAASTGDMLIDDIRNVTGDLQMDDYPDLVNLLRGLDNDEVTKKVLGMLTKEERNNFNFFNEMKDKRGGTGYYSKEAANTRGVVVNANDGKEYVKISPNGYMLKENAVLKERLRRDKNKMTYVWSSEGKGNPNIIPFRQPTLSDNPIFERRRQKLKEKQIDKRGGEKYEPKTTTPSATIESFRNGLENYLKDNYDYDDNLKKYINVSKNFKEHARASGYLDDVPGVEDNYTLNKLSGTVAGKKIKDDLVVISESATPAWNLLQDFRKKYPSISGNQLYKTGRDELNRNPELRFTEIVGRSDKSVYGKGQTKNYEDFTKLYEKVKPDTLNDPSNPYYKDFQTFKSIDKTRIEVNELLKPVLNKIFPGGNQSVQIAHKFSLGKIPYEEGLKGKVGQGGSPDAYFLDFKEINFTQQEQGFERQARSAIADFDKEMKKGEDLVAITRAAQKILDVNDKYSGVGVTSMIGSGDSSVAYNFGAKEVPFKDRLIIFMDAAKKKYGERIFTPDDYEAVEQAILKLESNPNILNKAEGGLIGDMIPVKANVGGFFSKLFGKPPAFRKEGMDVSNVYGPTKAQQQTLEQLYPGQAFPDYVPGEVFYSNLDLSLSKRDAPLIFNNNKEFRDYMNQSGVGVDELNDAKVLNFVNQKFKEGQPVLAKDILDISSQSPVRNVYIDGYGFRSDKINKAPKTELDNFGGVRVKEGDPIQKSANYPSQGLLDGFDDGTYKERVLRINKGNLRGDTGQVPGGTAHSFGESYDDGANNYVIAWTRQTDRSGKIIPGQTIDRETGELVTAGQLADQTRLTELEKRINRLFEDPITSLNPDDMAGVTAAVNRLVEKNPNLTQSRAFNIVNQQITSKQKELKKLQNQYNEEAARIKSFKPEAEQEIKLTVIDELQSDVMQSMNRKARELAARLEVMAEDGIPLTQMRDKELLEYFQATGDIRRPVGKTKTELMNQYNELMDMQKQLTALSRQPVYAITPANINLYRDTIKSRQAELIDQMSEEISNDLMRSLFPDLPFKDRVQYADALSKQAIAEAAYRLFVEKDPNAPRFIGFMSGEVVAGDAYSQTGRTSTSIAERKRDKLNRIDAFKSEIRAGNESAKIAPSGLPGVGTDEFYGGPLAKSRVGDGVEVDEIGGHYTSTMESVFKKIANQYGSELKIINVAASRPRRVDSYDIINQETKQVVGSGDTYRQAENIANDLVDSEGGRYTIDRNPKLQYDTRPIFGMEITPQMLQLFKAYK